MKIFTYNQGLGIASLCATCRWLHLLLCLNVLGMMAGKVQAETFHPLGDRLYTDADGSYYCVVTRTGGVRIRGAWGLVDIEIAKCRQNSPPIFPTSTIIREIVGEPNTFERKHGIRARVRPMDSVLGRLESFTPPAHVLVSSSGLGVVLIDQYGLNTAVAKGDAPAIVVLAVDGHIVHTKTLLALFTRDEVSQFERTLSGGILFYSGAWIDEARREIVIVGRSTRSTIPITVVNWDTGESRRGDADDIVRALSTKNAMGLMNALDLAKALRLTKAIPFLKSIADDKSLPIEARVRAIVWLAELGDKSKGDVIATAAVATSRRLCQTPEWQEMEQQQLNDVLSFIVTKMPVVLGKDALPVLLHVSAEQDYPYFAYEAFRQLGVDAVPGLNVMLRDNKNPKAVVFAANVLGDIQPTNSESLRLLIRLIETLPSDGNEQIRLAASRALGKCGSNARAALPLLLKLQQHNNEQLRCAAADAVNLIERGNPAKATRP